MAATSNNSTLQQAAMASAASGGMTPARASARASAASKVSIPCTCAPDEKTADICAVLNKASSGSGMADSPSDVEERGLVRALQDDVEAVDNRCAIGLTAGQQGGASFGRNVLQHRIFGVGRLVGEVEARHGVVEQAARKDGDTD